MPPWGLTPAPPTNTKNVNTSGYERSPAPDYYVFLTDAVPRARTGTSTSSGAGTTATVKGYQDFRAEFLKLTGATPLLPDYAFGTWYTWWHNYTQAEAEAAVAHWAAERIPLDVWPVKQSRPE